MFLAAVPAQIKVDWASLWMNMGWMDIVFLLTFAFGVFLGLQKGLSKVFPVFFEVVTAQTVSIEYSKTLAEFLYVRIPIPVEFLHIGVFAVLAIACIILVRLLFQLLLLFASVDFKSPVNNAGGAILSGVAWFLYLSLISSFLVLFQIPFIQETFTGRSISGPYLVKSSQRVHDFFVKFFPRSWRMSESTTSAKRTHR